MFTLAQTSVLGRAWMLMQAWGADAVRFREHVTERVSRTCSHIDVAYWSYPRQLVHGSLDRRVGEKFHGKFGEREGILKALHKS